MKTSVLAALPLVALIAGAAVPTALSAQPSTAPRQAQPTETLETLLSEVRNIGPKTEPTLLAVKLARYIKAAKPDLKPLALELEANTSARQRSILLLALAQNADMAVPVLPVLIKIATGDESQNLRNMALVTIGDMGPAAVSAVAPLQAIVQDEKQEPLTRVYAANALGGIGPAAKPAYDAIFDLLRSVRNYPDALNADMCGRFLGAALIRIDPTPAGKKALIALLGKSDDPAIRAALAKVSEVPQEGMPP